MCAVWRGVTSMQQSMSPQALSVLQDLLVVLRPLTMASRGPRAAGPRVA